MNEILKFIRESNRIEGITRAPTKREIAATGAFLSQERVTIAGLQAFVAAVAPGRPLRDAPGMNVRVGSHVAPPGGLYIPERLEVILARANGGTVSAYEAHHWYETLHPFMDGNGRSGRVLWLWMMLQAGHDPYALKRGFLHTFYYQALSAGRP